jgi:hypothetical protein
MLEQSLWPVLQNPITRLQQAGQSVIEIVRPIDQHSQFNRAGVFVCPWLDLSAILGRIRLLIWASIVVAGIR